MMPIARSVDRNLKFPLFPVPCMSPESPWTVSNRYMITPVGPGLGAATQSQQPTTINTQPACLVTPQDNSRSSVCRTPIQRGVFLRLFHFQIGLARRVGAKNGLIFTNYMYGKCQWYVLERLFCFWGMAQRLRRHIRAKCKICAGRRSLTTKEIDRLTSPIYW